MKTVSVTAHFDGKQIQLDEPLDLKANTKLMVTVLAEENNEHLAWQQLAANNLANAYSDDEESYSLDDLKVSNPAYEGR